MHDNEGESGSVLMRHGRALVVLWRRLGMCRAMQSDMSGDRESGRFQGHRASTPYSMKFCL